MRDVRSCALGELCKLSCRGDEWPWPGDPARIPSFSARNARVVVFL
jgi:hypothetical protein